MPSPCGIQAWCPPDISMCSPTEKLHWALLSRVFTEIPLHRHVRLKHQLHYWMQSPTCSYPSSQADPESQLSNLKIILIDDQPSFWSYLGTHHELLHENNSDYHWGNSKRFWSSVLGKKDKDQIYSLLYHGVITSCSAQIWYTWERFLSCWT